MNIHNVVTFIAEISYYLGAFALLALFPFIADAAPRWPLLERYAAFIPNRFVFLAGTVNSIFSVKTWNVLLTQLAFYGSLAALVVYGLALSRAGRVHEAWLFTGSAVTLAVCTWFCFLTGTTWSGVGTTQNTRNSSSQSASRFLRPRLR